MRAAIEKAGLGPIGTVQLLDAFWWRAAADHLLPAS